MACASMCTIIFGPLVHEVHMHAFLSFHMSVGKLVAILMGFPSCDFCFDICSYVSFNLLFLSFIFSVLIIIYQV